MPTKSMFPTLLSLVTRPRQLAATTALLAAALLPAQSQAAIVTSTDTNPPPPSEVLLGIAQSGTSNAQWRYTTSSRRDIGQTFLVPGSEGDSATVSGFTFRLPSSTVVGGIGSAADDAAFSLSIYSFTDNTDFTPDGPAVYTSTGALPSVLNWQDYITFALETPVSLTSNRYYGVQLTFTTPLANQTLNFITGAASSYSSGTAFFYESDGYKSYSGDFQMSVLTIPEPHTYALIGLTALGLFLVRRRRMRSLAAVAASAITLSTATAKESPSRTILLLGDSTVVSYKADSPIQGWGHFLPQYLTPDWQVVNLAKGGASAKTFLTFPQWQDAQKVKSDYVFIQFGHNDAHGPGRPESTDASSDFKTHLKEYITWARSHGSKPVLVTPMHRRTFAKNGTLNDSLRPYADAVRAVAQEENVPVIDLHAASGEWFLSLGEAASADLTGPNNDLSHFSPKGADWLASRVALQARQIDDTLGQAFAGNATSH